MNIDTNEKLQLGAFHFFGESVAVLGIKGSGNHNYKYSAKGIRATLAKEYPALDVEKMVEQILRIE